MTNLSDTRIRSETNLWADNVHKLTSKIENKQTVLDSINSQLSKIDKALDNTEYNNARSNYDDLANQVSTLSTKLAKAKSKATINKLNAELTSAKANKAQYAQKMKQIASANGFTSKLSSRTRKAQNKKAVAKLIANLKAQRANAKAKADYYKNVLIQRQYAETAKRNAPVIAEQVNQGRNAGHTMLFRSDMQDDTVFELIETSPSQTDSNDIATRPIDGSQTETNFIARSSMEYTATFYLKGDSFAELDALYQKLSSWSYQYEFTIQGFSHWTHAFISSIGKSTDQTINSNGLILNITFNFARQADIKYKQVTKGNLSHKAGSKKQSGTRNGKTAKYITVKPGMTYSQIAKKMNVSLSDVMSMNKYKSTAIPVGAKVRYQ